MAAVPKVRGHLKGRHREGEGGGGRKKRDQSAKGSWVRLVGDLARGGAWSRRPGGPS